MLIVPIIDSPAQTLTVTLGGQSCRIDIYTRTFGLYCDLYVSDVLILGGVVCQNLNQIVRDSYLGFIGDLIFEDTQGTEDPSNPGLGSRFILIYLEAADLASYGL